MFKLSEKEIRQKFQELANYKNLLHPRLKERNQRLHGRVKELEDENKKLKEENKQVQKIMLELEELKEMVYGKRQTPMKNKKIPLPAKDSRKWEQPKEKRSAESYRKSEPTKDEITWEIKFDLNDWCPDCWSHNITAIQENIFYREDLEELDILLKQAKTITKKIIETWYCWNCKKRKSAFELPKQKVSIWRNTKATVVYLHIILWLSYSEVISHLKSMFNIDISSWQISNILEEQSDLLKPYYQDIYNSLQAQEPWCHYDETSWKIIWENIEANEWNTKENWAKKKKKNNWWDWEWNYCWTKTWVISNNVLFWFWRSRWKGVAEKLRWETEIKKWDNDYIKKLKQLIKDQVWVSDDYWSYRNNFENHQLCWAHPFRKIKDLAQSWVLDSPILAHCIKVYENFSDLYEKVQKARDKFNEWDNIKIKINWEYEDYWWYKSKKDRDKDIEKLKKEFDKITAPHKKDPEKLKTIKESLKDRKDRYFTCLMIKQIPLDNNKAERVLRKIVLKRKKSFWCKSQKWANVLSVLYSVCFSIFWSNPPEEFLSKYYKALDIDITTKD